MSSNALKKSLSRIKFRLLDDWPYIPAEKKSIRLRTAQRHHLDSLPPIDVPRDKSCEIHMLCGKANVDMGIWASWSFCRHLPGYPLYVHSDGTLAEEDTRLWARIIPHFEFVAKAEAEERLRDQNSRFDHIRDWRRINNYSRKLIDLQLFGSSPKVFILDSDVLCFRRPDALIDAMDSDATQMAWNEDVKSFYAAPPELIEEKLNLAIPRNFNSGVLVTRRFDDEDFALIDRAISEFSETPYPEIPWFEQALYSVVAGSRGSSRPLPPAYSVCFGKTAPEAIVRHYVGARQIRPRFFLEGVPKILDSPG